MMKKLWQKRQIVFLSLIFILLGFIVVSWIWSYFAVHGFAVSMGDNSRFKVMSFYGIIEFGTDEGFDNHPSTKLYAEDPAIYDEAIISARYFGMKMKTLREMPSFAYESQSVEHRGRLMSWTTVSFPHWLLAAIFTLPLLCWFGIQKRHWFQRIFHSV